MRTETAQTWPTTTPGSIAEPLPSAFFPTRGGVESPTSTMNTMETHVCTLCSNSSCGVDNAEGVERFDPAEIFDAERIPFCVSCGTPSSTFPSSSSLACEEGLRPYSCGLCVSTVDLVVSVSFVTPDMSYGSTALSSIIQPGGAHST